MINNLVALVDLEKLSFRKVELICTAYNIQGLYRNAVSPHP